MAALHHCHLIFGENGDGTCCTCGGLTLAVGTDSWRIGEPSEELAGVLAATDKEPGDFAEPLGEVSANWCPECNVITAIYVNP